MFDTHNIEFTSLKTSVKEAADCWEYAPEWVHATWSAIKLAVVVYCFITVTMILSQPDIIGRKISSDVIQNKVNMRNLVNQLSATRDIQGPSGEPGPQGLQGIQGDTGPTGPRGETGRNCVLDDENLATIRQFLSPGTQIYVDKKGPGTVGGFSADISRGWIIRTLNHAEEGGTLDGSITSLVSSMVTLQPGYRYDLVAEIPGCGVGRHIGRIWDETHRRILVYGTGELSPAGSSSSRSIARVTVSVVDEPLTIRLDHKTENAVFAGLGCAMGLSGIDETYSRLTITAHRLV